MELVIFNPPPLRTQILFRFIFSPFSPQPGHRSDHRGVVEGHSKLAQGSHLPVRDDAEGRPAQDLPPATVRLRLSGAPVLLPRPT